MITMNFVKGGKAIFTSSNDKGKHYTYKVKKVKSPQQSMVEDPLYVWLLTGPNLYTYLGMMVNNRIRLTYKSKMTADSIPVRVFDFTMKVIEGKMQLPLNYNIQHEGKCGKCGRPLTDPESISTGFGPICRSFH